MISSSYCPRMTPSEEVRTRAQEVVTLLSEEMTVRFSAYSKVHNFDFKN